MSKSSWFWELNTYGKIIVIMLSVLGFFTFDAYFKSDLAEKVKLLKKEMMQSCNREEHCQKIVQANFQKCFDDNFDEDSLGHYARFDEEGFSNCMNTKADFDYFTPIRLSDL